ncbi:MAG: HD domain-containing protein [Candidatus Diapherotrites archaeon]
MAWEKWYPVLLGEMEKQMETSPQISPVHKTDHILRVWTKSKILCEKLKGDMEVMVATVLLHDLGRHYGLEIHGEKSVELAKPILDKHEFPKEKIPLVLEAIAQHDYTFPAENRKLLEAKILYDVDKMDALGIIGVYRHILFIEAGRITMEDVVALCTKRYEGLALKESKDLAKNDYEYIVNFFKDLEIQLSGG